MSGHNTRKTDPASASELSSGERAAVVRQVHAGQEPHLRAHPEHQKAAENFAKEVRERDAQEGHEGKAHGKGHTGHHRGDLSSGEKSVVTRTVKAGGNLEDIHFVQGHPNKLEKAKAYAAEVKARGDE